MFGNKNIFLILGPLLFLVFYYIGPPATINKEAYHLLLIVLWMAIWWTTEALPIAVTALLPLILFPLFCYDPAIEFGMDISKTAEAYSSKITFLFIGGFIVALAIEKWNLHKRIALHIIWLTGKNIPKIILGFMIATAFLSMWISNTATTVMMLPIGLSIIGQLKKNPNTNKAENNRFAKALMLSIAFSASIGGIATLIGTPPNLILASFIEKQANVEISFLQWMKFGLPVSIFLLLLAWIYLTKIAFNFNNKEFIYGKQEIAIQLKNLGPMKIEEKLVLLIFGLTVFSWTTRSVIINHFFPKIDDTIIAVSAALLLFIIPSKTKNEKLMSWNDAIKLPWGILLLFGGGLAIASGFETTGLADWIGSQITLLDTLSLLTIVFLIVGLVNFLTEITSNLATTTMLLPIMASFAISLEVNSNLFLVATTVAASCAFMLPVATPPNAVVFGSGYLKVSDMVKVGFWMNIISIIIISLFVSFLLPYLWGF